MPTYPSVLITGAAGRLGQALVPLLRAHGYRAVGTDLAPGPTVDVLLDVRDADAVLATTRGFDAIVHTAALHGKHYEEGAPRLDFVRTNIEGTLHLLEACHQHGIGKYQHYIYLRASHDAPTQAVWVDEALVPEPRDIYDISKQAAEALCRDFFEKEHVQTVVLRTSRFLPEPAHLALTHRLYRGVDVRDAALGHLLALEHEFASFEVFNISGGGPFERPDLELLKQGPETVIRQRLPEAATVYEQLNWPFPASIDRVYSIEKAQRILGYQPRFTAAALAQQALRSSAQF